MFIPLQFGIGQGPAGHKRYTSYPMRLFSTDLFRNFGIGFVVGTVLVVGANAQDWGGAMASPAQAAEVLQAPAPSAEFVIAPEGR
jgi:hypothetical protein